ncbi:MAG: indole-3-glycerol phosphate synthase TrpC [bacterium]
MKGILAEIVENKKQEVERRKQVRPLEELIEASKTMPPARDFHAALRRGGGPMRLLAEIKTASPSTGTIRADIDPGAIAALYESCGAAAISVLTDARYFNGSDAHLEEARAAVSVPVLRKDFTIDAYQLYESRVIGADAVLLMAQVLSGEVFAMLYRQARSMGLQVLAEGHTPEQIEFLVSLGAEVIGINNRDFETMTVDIQTTLKNRALIPPDRVLVSQSGVSRREDVIRLEEAEVDAIQVGTSLMRNQNIRKQLAELMGRPPDAV